MENYLHLIPAIVVVVLEVIVCGWAVLRNPEDEDDWFSFYDEDFTISDDDFENDFLEDDLTTEEFVDFEMMFSTKDVWELPFDDGFWH